MGERLSMEKNKESAYLCWLSSFYTISPEKRRHAIALAGNAERLYRMTQEQIDALHLFTEKEQARIMASRRTDFSPEEAWERFQKTNQRVGMRFIPFGDPAYPERLRYIYNAPFALFVKGNLPSDERKSVGIVGARGCSEYGRSVATKLGRTLAEHGVQVVSGMAVGIDSASQAGALSVGGATFAVLGSGCDICYPRSSRNIYDNILAGPGGVLSELLPGTQPQPMFFPMRNRIISALSDVLVVVEARERSGSLITADFALEQGKDVYAVPGRYLDNLSVGCNRLIEQGAGIFVDMDSFLKNIGIAAETEKKKTPAARLPITGEAQRVYDCLELSVKYIDAIAEESGLDLLTVINALESLKKNKLAQESFQNYFCKTI